MVARIQTGKIIQIVGVVVDVEFEKGKLPPINDALEITHNKEKIILIQYPLGRSVISSYEIVSTITTIKQFCDMKKFYFLLNWLYF